MWTNISPQETLVNSFPPSKEENIPAWCVFPLQDMPENVKKKVMRLFHLKLRNVKQTDFTQNWRKSYVGLGEKSKQQEKESHTWCQNKSLRRLKDYLQVYIAKASQWDG